MREYVVDINSVKEGSKIILNDNTEYIVIEKRKENGQNYLVVCTTKSPIIPYIFKYEIDKDKILIVEEKSNKILETIYLKMIKENS